MFTFYVSITVKLLSFKVPFLCESAIKPQPTDMLTGHSLTWKTLKTSGNLSIWKTPGILC